MNKTILILTVLLISTVALAGDILLLKNNMVFEWKVTNIKECEVFFKADRKKYVVPASEISSLKFESPNKKFVLASNVIAEEDSSACVKGASDAKKYHGKIASHIVLGMFLGPYAMIGTAFANPTPEKGERTYTMSDNKELFDDPDYLECYKKKAKRKLIQMEAIGTGIGLTALIILLRDQFE